VSLTRDFRATVAARARRDPRFRESMLAEALNATFAGDVGAGKRILRDLVNATIGFEGLAAATGRPSKSLHRMLAPRGNPSTANFFEIVWAMQRHSRVKLRVAVRAA
jgi:DNA-binding phage protein